MTDGNTDQNSDRDDGLSGEGCSEAESSDQGRSAEDLEGKVSRGRVSAAGAAAEAAGVASCFGVKSSRIE
jgi:hypothetical protein